MRRGGLEPVSRCGVLSQSQVWRLVRVHGYGGHIHTRDAKPSSVATLDGGPKNLATEPATPHSQRLKGEGTMLPLGDRSPASSL